jgi:hypothetical protein
MSKITESEHDVAEWDVLDGYNNGAGVLVAVVGAGSVTPTDDDDDV